MLIDQAPEAASLENTKKAFLFRHEWGAVYIAFADSLEDAWNLVDSYQAFAKQERYRWLFIEQFDLQGIHKIYEQPDDKFY